MRFWLGVWPLLLASTAQADAVLVTGESFTFPLPDGYEDISAAMRARGASPQTTSVVAKAKSHGYLPSITFQKTPIQTHTTDLATCRQNAAMIASGVNGKVKSATMIAGPAGAACQMNIVAPDGVALITELDQANATWLMTCNHADGDAAAEKVCLATLAAFKFKK